MIGEEQIPNYPNPPESFVTEFHRLMDKYQVTPTNLDTFVDLSWGHHRQMTLKEEVDTLGEHIKLAKRMGFPVVRPTTLKVNVPAPQIAEGALTYAEKYDVKIAPEIHMPIPFKGEWIDGYMEVITRTKTQHLGFTLDFGVFQEMKGMPPMKLPENATPEMKKMMQEMANYKPWDPAADIPPLLPYIYNCHGKFYEMADDYHETSIAYEKIIPVLVEGGYSHSIDSEFEGQRQRENTDSVEEVRRHHLMLRRLLGEV
jgi:hypothetical protein